MMADRSVHRHEPHHEPLFFPSSIIRTISNEHSIRCSSSGHQTGDNDDGWHGCTSGCGRAGECRSRRLVCGHGGSKSRSGSDTCGWNAVMDLLYRIVCKFLSPYSVINTVHTIEHLFRSHVILTTFRRTSINTHTASISCYRSSSHSNVSRRYAKPQAVPSASMSYLFAKTHRKDSHTILINLL